MTINNYTAFMGGYLSESGIFLKGCVIIYVFVLKELAYYWQLWATAETIRWKRPLKPSACSSKPLFFRRRPTGFL
jgi:hypothetical protein